MNLWYRVEPTLRRIRELVQDQWFDRTRRVRTSGNLSLRASDIAADHHPDSEWYMPARPAHIRHALHHLPHADLTTFRYVDLGCGKGRSLFVAAELPFREILGVELSPVLFAQSQRNLHTFHPYRRRVSPPIATLHQNALDFRFPTGNLVLYLFNPFGRDTMQTVLDHLDSTRRQHPAHIIVVLLWPRCQDQVAALEGMHLHHSTPQYQIFSAPPLRVPQA